MNTIKELALIEPLVDEVYNNTICTNEVPILNVDIMTVKKEDLDFKSNFTLNVTRNDYIHAFVVYFDCEFSFGTKRFTLSTCIFFNFIYIFYILYFDSSTQKCYSLEANSLLYKDSFDCMSR